MLTTTPPSPVFVHVKHQFNLIYAENLTSVAVDACMHACGWVGCCVGCGGLWVKALGGRWLHVYMLQPHIKLFEILRRIVVYSCNLTNWESNCTDNYLLTLNIEHWFPETEHIDISILTMRTAGLIFFSFYSVFDWLNMDADALMCRNRVAPASPSKDSANTAAVSDASPSLAKSVFYLSACLPAFLPVCLPVCLPACLSACLSACLPVCLPAYLSVCLLSYLCLPSFLSVSLCVYLDDHVTDTMLFFFTDLFSIVPTIFSTKLFTSVLHYHSN